MSWTDEIPNDVGSVVELLKKHNCFGSVIFELLFCICCAVTFIVNDWDVYSLVIALGSFVISAKTIELAFAKERVEKVEETAADLTDKLIIKKHEAERLAIELDAAQEAFMDCKRRREEQEARMKEQAGEAIPAATDTAPSEAPKPKPKRRPAPKRKPTGGNANGNGNQG